MSIRNIAVCNILVCGFLALTGCKSPNWFGFADKTATAPDTQIAATRAPVPEGRPPDGPAPAAAEPTASESAVNLSSWRKATEWLTLRRSRKAPAEDMLAKDRALERQLSNKAIQPQGLSYTNVPENPAAGNYPPAFNRTAVSPAEERLTTGTPSLVRRSRRPPPDPAPKLQQNRLLASDAATQNPFAHPAVREGTDPSSERSLYKMIESASRSWRMVPAQDTSLAGSPVADPTHSTASAHANEGLNFLPPNLEKMRTSSDVVASTFSNTSSSAGQTAATSDSAQRKNAQPARSETIPRREDLLASRPLRSQSSPSGDTTADTSNAKSESDKQWSATTPGAKWIAKKTEPAKEQPKTTIASSKEITQPHDSRSVVAETFAANMFSPRHSSAAPQKSGSSARPKIETPTFSNLPKQRTSEFPLPSTGNSQPSQMVVGPQTDGSSGSQRPTEAVNHPLWLAASKPQQASPAQVSADKSTSATGPQVNRAEMPLAMPTTESQNTPKRRDTLLPKPVPATPPPQSYYSYYHRGMMPEAFSLVRRPSNATPTISPRAELAAQSPPTETLAPLIDGNTYRRQMAPSQHNWTTAQTAATQTAEQPAAAGTWLAAYQRLVGTGAKPRSSAQAPKTATKRSLHSDDSP